MLRWRRLFGRWRVGRVMGRRRRIGMRIGSVGSVVGEGEGLIRRIY